MDKNCLYGLLGLTGAIVSIVAMFLGYKVKVDKKTATLEKQDKQHEQKHHHNEERIKTLEEGLSEEQKKNGHQQRQIDILKEEMKKLKNK